MRSAYKHKQLHLSAVEKKIPPCTLGNRETAHRDALCQQLGRKQLFRAAVFLEELRHLICARSLRKQVEAATVDGPPVSPPPRCRIALVNQR